MIPATAVFTDIYKIPVNSRLLHQFLMGPGLRNRSVCNHKDLIGAPYRIQAVAMTSSVFP